MKGEFVTPLKDFGCSEVLELIDGEQRVGIVWKHDDEDSQYHWAVGDGSISCGLSADLEEAKSALLGACA